jgi:hypothetical protein
MRTTERQHHNLTHITAAVIGAWLLAASVSGTAAAPAMPPEYADAAKLERAEQVFRITQGLPTG